MNEMISAVSAASTTRSVMYEKTLNARMCFSSSWASSSSMATSRGSRERVGHALHLHEARALHEERRARRRFLARGLHQRLDRVEVTRAGPERRDRRVAVGAQREERVELLRARELAHLGVQRARLRPQLAHVA